MKNPLVAQKKSILLLKIFCTKSNIAIIYNLRIYKGSKAFLKMQSKEGLACREYFMEIWLCFEAFYIFYKYTYVVKNE